MIPTAGYIVRFTMLDHTSAVTGAGIGPSTAVSGAGGCLCQDKLCFIVAQMET